MFNLPRIACWPIDSDFQTNSTSPYTTGYDRLIAFCSSLKIGGTTAAPYYFQRSTANDGSEGGSTGNYDWDSIPNPLSTTTPRNQQLYSYLQYLTSQNTPGFGGNLAAKYPVVGSTSERDQILSEIFDYIRCTNPNDAGLLTNLSAPAAPYYQYLSPHTNYNKSVNGSLVSQQWIKPSKISTTTGGSAATTMGFGRTFTIREVALELVCVGDAGVTPSKAGPPAVAAQPAGNTSNWDGNNTANPLLSSITPVDPTTKGPLAQGEKRYQAALIFRVQCVSPGNGYPNAGSFITVLRHKQSFLPRWIGWPLLGSHQSHRPYQSVR